MAPEGPWGGSGAPNLAPSTRGTSWPSPGRRCTAPVPGCTSAAGPGQPSPGPAPPPGPRSAGPRRRVGWQSSPSPKQSCRRNATRTALLPRLGVHCARWPFPPCTPAWLPPQNRALNANAALERKAPASARVSATARCCMPAQLPGSFNGPLFQQCYGGQQGEHG